ncbi:UPF0158 family protein [Streptomyces sp. NBC_00078]|uniref:UPF0158 family protein n=1 Tax=unclassified Streptomyces TaxID=2593676 RepID=UPI00224CD031|nr:UPF0158 family protein [Streptomyces sp. NBC_00078]MCX5422607.1 UPF0158 family protein [Streptomyces sp. NBC_00078]
MPAPGDGRLGLWEPRHVEELLLGWLPETITELPGEERGDAPGTLRTLLRYLHAARLADPRGPALEDSLAAVDAVAELYPGAMADRSRWGLAKFWATAAAEQGVDVLDGAALQRFAERAQRGEVAYDQQALDMVMERRLTGRALSGVARAEPQLPVVLPPDDALRERGFRGDEELADRLRAAMGDAAIPLLRPLAVDLEMLAMLLEADPAESGGRIDLSTGECWPAFTDELEPGAGGEEADDPDRWLYVPALGSRAGYRDMELFIDGLGDVALADRLRIAITGRGAFRRFKDVLARDERARRRYHRLSDERQRGRARAWLVEEGYCPAASCSASSR